MTKGQQWTALATALVAVVACSNAGKATAPAEDATVIAVDGSADSAHDGAAVEVSQDGADDTASTDAAPDSAKPCPGPCTTTDPCQVAACDGQTGQCATTAKPAGSGCDDGEPCTIGETCGDGKCSGGQLGANCGCLDNADCAKKDDGKLCNGIQFCDKSQPVWVCKLNPATVFDCPPATDACHISKCVEPGSPGGDPNSAKCAVVLADDGTPCEDGKAFTIGDVCEKGSCLAGTKTALCTETSDCAKYEDGDLCNGTLFCNKASKACEVNAATVVVCPSAADTACAVNVCSKASGKCALVSQNELKPCDDGNPCSLGDKCLAGQCTGSANTCTCQKDSDCSKSEDGDLCNGTLFCDASLHCVLNPATVVTCPTGLDTACAKQKCVKSTGNCAAVPLPDGVTCDADGSPCTPNDTCDKVGNCVAGIDLCCHEAIECQDSSVCNGPEYCDKSVFPFACKPPVALAKDGTACSDGSACTTADVCKSGVCLGGELTPCNDQNACTADSCEAKKGCVYTAQANACDDGDACTVGDGCAGPVCSAGKPKGCDDGNPCTADSCDKATGCTAANLPNGVTCSDGDACTTADQCAKGACGGKPAYPEAVIHTTPNEQAFTGAVLQPDGSIVTLENFKVAGKQSARLVSLDTAGLGKLDTKLDGQPDAQLYSLVADGDGWAAVGKAVTANGSDVFFVRVNAAGVAIVQSAIDLGGDEEGYALAKAGGSFVLVGFRSIPEPGSAVAIVVNDQGKCIQNCSTTVQAFKGAVNTSFNAIWSLADGSLLVAGESQTGANFGALDALVVRLSSTGVLTTPQMFGGSGDDRFWQARPGPQGGVVALGSKGGKAWLLGADALGNVLWQSTLGTAKDGQDMRPAPFGWVVAAWTPGAQALIGTDAVGNVLWQRTLLGSPYTLLATATGYAIVGDLQGDAQVVFTDPWGHSSCKDAGKCLGVAACGDGKACTDDVCVATLGCTAAIAADGQPCDDGSLCESADVCTAGKCKSGVPVLFDKGFGGAGGDSGLAVVALSDGAVVAGATASFGSGQDDGWLVRSDSTGKIMFSKTFGDGGIDRFAAVVEVSAGFVAAGRTANGNGPSDAWLVATDSLGNLKWQQAYGGAHADLAHGLVVANDGFALAGSTQALSGGDSDAYVVRTDGAGKVLWSQSFGASGVDEVYQAIAATGSGLLCVGYKVTTSGQSAILRGLDPGGNSLWDKALGAAPSELRAVVALPGGGAFAAGTTPGGLGGADGWLLRLDSSGNVLWQRVYGGAGSDSWASVAVQNGLALLAGKNESSGSGNGDGWLMAVDGNGATQWQHVLGAPPYEALLGAVWTTTGVWATGQSDAKGQGGQDLWLLHTDLWGNAACAQGALCLAQAPTNCDDGDPCTLDGCAKTGCSHAPMALGGYCGVGKACAFDKTLVCLANDTAPMVAQPGGTFLMGAKAGSGNPAAEPQHLVTLSPFGLDVHEVTLGQYKAFYASLAKGQQTAGENTNGFFYGNPGTGPGCVWGSAKDNLPINCVDWPQAQAYCAWAGKRLPTEAEWEFAASNGAKAEPYPWGSSAPSCAFAVMEDAAKGGKGCGSNASAPTCSIGAGHSALGVCDLMGNVTEWVFDYHKAYGADSQVNPQGPSSGTQRVVRGGGWDQSAAAGLVFGARMREYLTPTVHSASLGFRCAK